MPSCDIVIPIYQGQTVLPLTLAALRAQVFPPAWRVRTLLSDDGSTDSTVAVASKLTAASPWPALILTNAHAGAAAARNRALDEATADIILLLAQDILLRPGALAAHLAWHEHHPDAREAALGFIRWDPRLPPSALMEWMMHGGTQNNFDALLGRRKVAAEHFFYGSHVSIKRAFIGSARFTTAFTEYGWEDIDFGRRMARRGLQLYFLPEARGLHHHYYTTEAIIRRQRSVGRGLITYQRRHPAATLMPAMSGARRALLWLRLNALSVAVAGWLLERDRMRSRPGLFRLLATGAFWHGVSMGDVRNNPAPAAKIKYT